MAIRQSGRDAARAVETFVAALNGARNASPALADKIDYYLTGIAAAIDRVEAALRQDDEDMLSDALLPIPGTARDFDAIDFNPRDVAIVGSSYDDLVRKKAAFFLDLDPTLKP